MKCTFATITVAVAMSAGVGFAQDIKAPDEILTARHGYMLSLAMNVAPLAGMAKGEVPFDATVAKVAAQNLANLAALDTAYLWVPGTEAGVLADSSALPDVIAQPEVRTAKIARMKTAADAMVVAAATDLGALKGAMGAVGGACGDCHKTFRQPE